MNRLKWALRWLTCKHKNKHVVVEYSYSYVPGTPESHVKIERCNRCGIVTVFYDGESTGMTY